MTTDVSIHIVHALLVSSQYHRQKTESHDAVMLELPYLKAYGRSYDRSIVEDCSCYSTSVIARDLVDDAPNLV